VVLLESTIVLDEIHSIVDLFVCQRIPLDFLQGDKFREAVENYIRPLLTKVYKVPFHILCALFSCFKIN